MADDNDSERLLGEAARLRRMGRVPEAIDAYARLLALRPDLADSWYNLGLLHRQAGNFDAALAAYQRALDQNIRGPEEVHLNRAVIYADHLRDDAAAERELNTALTLNPGYEPALFNLANLREDQGRRDEAVSLYRRVLADNPNAHEALARFANLQTLSSASDPLAQQLKQAIGRANVGVADKAGLGFVLGKLLDAAGAHDDAWVAYEAANRHSRESGGGVKYDRAAQEKLIDNIIDAFPSAPSPLANAAECPSIFVCGMFRSGSTLAEHVLARHPRVTAGGELGALAEIVHARFTPYPDSAKSSTPDDFALASADYRATLDKLFPDADRITDKRPDNFLHIGLIKRMFPDAKIVNTMRDAMDNALSIYFLHLDQRMSYALDLDDIAHYFGQYRRLMAHWKALYPNDILDFDYDAFVHDPTPNVERLLKFCGLKWDAACLSPHLAAGAVKTASVWQVREPLYARSSGRAKNYERHLSSLRKSLDEFAT